MKYNNHTWLLEKILGEGGHDAINKYFSEKAAAEEHRRREAERKRREAEARREAERKRREEEARREAERKRKAEEARREAERKRREAEAKTSTSGYIIILFFFPHPQIRVHKFNYAHYGSKHIRFHELYAKQL